MLFGRFLFHIVPFNNDSLKLAHNDINTCAIGKQKGDLQILVDPLQPAEYGHRIFVSVGHRHRHPYRYCFLFLKNEMSNGTEVTSTIPITINSTCSFNNGNLLPSKYPDITIVVIQMNAPKKL